MAGSAHPLQQCLHLRFRTSQRSQLLEGHPGLAQVWTQVLVREESILVILHVLESATTEAYASFNGCIFYAFLHASTVSMVRIV